MLQSIPISLILTGFVVLLLFLCLYVYLCTPKGEKYKINIRQEESIPLLLPVSYA